MVLHLIRYGRLFALVAAFAGLPSTGETAESAQSEKVSTLEDLVAEVFELTDLVLDKHIDPPARQQMLLAGVKEIYRSYGRPVPHGLARRLSQAGDEQATRGLLSELIAEAMKSAKYDMSVNPVMKRGVLSAVAGNPQLIAASEYRVNQQLSENRYEGIGISLGRDGKTGLPVINQAFPRGPARLAGAKSNDRILSVDGIEMKGKSLRDYIDALRGKRGEPVSIVVQQPDADDKRTLDMVRGVIPFETVVGQRRVDDEHWDYRTEGDKDIAYIHINSIRGSTASEIRQVSRKLRSDGSRAVILDLRKTNPAADVHHTVLLADAFLDGGLIGKVQFADREQSFEAHGECVFREMPLAVLIDRSTSGDAEWLAAALQDRKRAVVVGEQSSGRGVTESSIALSSGDAVTMPTGIFLRADGRRLLGARRPLEMRPQVRSGAHPQLGNEPYRNGVMPDIPLPNPRQTLNDLAPVKKAVEVLKQTLAKTD